MTDNKSPGDLWCTPPEVMNYLTHRFGHITMDLCSSDENKICKNNLNEECDFLDDSWVSYVPEEFNFVPGDLAFCNPPYSGPLPFVKQCIKWAKYGYAVTGILNFDPSTKWFCELVNAKALIMPIIGGRIAFLNNDGIAAKGNNKPQFMFYLAPFLAQSVSTEYVNKSELYK